MGPDFGSFHESDIAPYIFMVFSIMLWKILSSFSCPWHFLLMSAIWLVTEQVARSMDSVIYSKDGKSLAISHII